MPRTLSRPEHTLSRSRISNNTLKVMYRLHHAGYLAFLVGGGVRDLLLGRRPKDFDVCTNARPREIRRLFRNSRIIGRRFRLVHVVFRDEVVEVATFRASPEPDEMEEWDDADGPPPEDLFNGDEPEVEEYGTPQEDARRRDLTVNGLYYNIADFSVIDYVGGLDDLEAGVVRTIGEPQRRFEEDPVRMMRALEYSVRLGFEIEEETEQAIHECADFIREASPARLTYELLETLGSGHAAGICAAWNRCGIFDRAFPELAPAPPKLTEVLAELDARLADGRRLTSAMLLGSLFLPRFVALVEQSTDDAGRINNPALLELLRDVLAPAMARMHVANRNSHLIHNGLFATTKLRRPPERGRQVMKLARQDSFDVTWELHSIGVNAGLLPAETHSAWARAVALVHEQGPSAMDELMGNKPRSRRSRRRPRRRRKHGRSGKDHAAS